MKITVGITTFNRIEYLKKMQQSLYLTDNVDSFAIRIYDDCSDEFGTEYLQQLFPTAAEITRRDTRLGADENLRQMYVDFLNTDDDVLVTMDADLICRPDWLNFTVDNFGHSEGIISLYNSVCHKPTREVILNCQTFVEKDHIGAAGSIIHRDILKEIVQNIPLADGYDLAWSAFLQANGRKKLVSKESYFQHIGLLGSHCNGFLKDFGLNFRPVHETNKKILHDCYLEAVQLRKDYVRKWRHIKREY